MSSEDNKTNSVPNSPENQDDAAQRKALNVNAKAFTPKLDDGNKSQPRTPAKANPQGGSSATGNGRSPGKKQPVQLPPNLTLPGMPIPGQPQMIPGLNPNLVAMPNVGMMPFGQPIIPGSPLVINPAAVVRPPMVPGVIPGVPPPSPSTPSAVPMFMQPPASPLSVNVGNASLNAIKNQTPPKFACILLVGTPGVGKTTVGRQLVQGLNDDELGWAFFSGSDFIQSKKLPHETLKDVFDALDQRLDDCLAKQKGPNPIRGLVIDKNCRGVEEVFYLSALLHSKGLSLTAIINLDVNDDSILLSRLSQGEEYREKIKYHRVILARIQEAAKPVGLWKSVDASGDKLTVSQTVRTMALGCSAQPPYKQLHPGSYSDSSNPLMSDYRTYASVMSTLFSLVKTAKPGQFPLNTNFTPLKESHLTGRKALIRDGYMVRRKVDGTRYALVFDGSGLYLVPRHMRAVLQMPKDAWLGIPLSNAGKFVLDGDLVRLTKERQKEKFVVSDVLYWGDKETGTNTIARANWEERQERLKVNLCNETTAFFPKKGDCVVVHQVSEALKHTMNLLELCDYGSDGLVFTPRSSRDPTIVWRMPESITVDFRLGPVTVNENNKKYPLEVFDQRVAKYVQYQNDVVEINNNRVSLVEGAIVCCGLDLTQPSGEHTWYYQRVRSDVPLAFMKTAVDELLADSIIPKVQLTKVLAQEKLIDANATGAATPAAADAKPAAPQQGTSAVSSATRVAFGSALDKEEKASPEKKEHADPKEQPSLLQRLKAVNPAVKVKVEGREEKKEAGNAVAVLENMLSSGVVRKGAKEAAAEKKEKEKADAKKEVESADQKDKSRTTRGTRGGQSKVRREEDRKRGDSKKEKADDAKADEKKEKEQPAKKEKAAKSDDKEKKEKTDRKNSKKDEKPAKKPDTKEKKEKEPKKEVAKEAKKEEAKKDEGSPSGGDSGDEAAGGDKPKRRRRGARGGANRASKRKAKEGEAAPAAPAKAE